MGNELSLHDRLFRHTFSTLENSVAFFQEFLPPSLSREISWETLETLPERYVEPKFRAAEVDLLFKARAADQEALLYVLFEHQSTNCPTMPLRLLRYMTAIWTRWLRDRASARRLPLIVPVVFYHGDGSWTAPSDFAHLIHLPPALADDAEVSGFVPKLKYTLVDVQKVPDSRLKSINLTALAGLVVRLFKHIHDKDLGRHLRSWVGDFRTVLRGPHGLQDFQMLIDYLSKASDGISVDDMEAVATELGQEAGEIIMTLAEQLKQEGRAEGREEGLQEGQTRGRRQLLHRQLQLKFGTDLPKDLPAILATASVQDIDRWAERVLSARTCEEVFQK